MSWHMFSPTADDCILILLAFLSFDFIHIVDFGLDSVKTFSRQNSALIVDDMIRAQVLRVQASPSVITSQMNPYKAQKTWPPDFSRLNSKHQFRLERKYRRRSKLKFARPGWVKGVKLAQWGVSLSVGAYCIFWMDWGPAGPAGAPFSGVREWCSKQLNAIWTVNNNRPQEAALRKSPDQEESASRS